MATLGLKEMGKFLWEGREKEEKVVMLKTSYVLSKHACLFRDFRVCTWTNQVFIALRTYNFAESADLGLGNLISLKLNSIKHEKCIFSMQMTWVVVIIKMDSKSFEKSKKGLETFYHYYSWLLIDVIIKMNSKIQRKNRLLAYFFFIQRKKGEQY